MEIADPGPADGEERMAELRPRTRSNPEGAEDRQSSNGGLNSPPPSQPTVGSRVEGEGEAASTDSPTGSTSTITTAISVPIAAAATTTASVMSSSVPASMAAAKERPKPSQPSITPQISSASELQLRVPRVNCPEKVIICLDLSEEMSLQKLESFNGSKTNALNISQKMIEMFVRTKHKIDKRHEFALVVVNDDALWLSGFTSDPRELCSCLYDLETNVCESFNLEDLLNIILQKIELPLMDNVQTIPPPFVVRTLLIYSRHAGQLQFNPSDAVSKMLRSPYFFFDVIYLHNGVDEQMDDNSWRFEEWFDGQDKEFNCSVVSLIEHLWNVLDKRVRAIRRLKGSAANVLVPDTTAHLQRQDKYESFSKLDSKGMCYRFEVSLCGPAIELHNCMAKLLCHPLQRPFQSHASYSLLEGDEPPEIEATV